MLKTVDVGAQRIESYRKSAGLDAIEELREIARPMRGVRVLHLSATPYGGGVAEILRSEVPLLRDLGLVADWRLITGDEAFFSVTKAIHNGLQGAPRPLSAGEWATYARQSERNAEELEGDYDVVVVHDPQPLPLPHLRGRGDSRWIWRCHIDTSEPEPGLWRSLLPYFDDYDAAVFTAQGFAPADFPARRVEIIAPAIDPESPKNIELSPHLSRRMLAWIGIDLERPLAVQVSRFDPWKDPLGVIEAWRLARREVPKLQLALVGAMALDDPEAWSMYDDIQAIGQDDPDLYVFTNLNGVGNIEVNAFQHLADVVIQKSLREGFGLVVSESLWKQTPVVAGRAGGIPLQLPPGIGGYLVDSTAQCAARVVELIEHPAEAAALGQAGRDHVRAHFLLPRLIAEEIRLYADLLRRAAPGG